MGKTLETEPDSDGKKFWDKCCVAVKKGNLTVSHVPKEISLPSNLLYMAKASHARLLANNNTLQRCRVGRCTMQIYFHHRK